MQLGRLSMNLKPKIAFLFLTSLLLGCSSSVKPIGQIGPKKLGVYEISHEDFLSGNRMLVVLDEHGNIAAYSGGTVTGAGVVGLQSITGLASAGAIYYGAKAIQNGMKNSNVTMKGIPNKVDVNTNSTINMNTNLNKAVG